MRVFGLLQSRCAFVVLSIAFLTSFAHADVSHTFTLDTKTWKEQPKSVSLAGSFNSFSKDATPLKQTSKNVWSAKVSAAEGLVTYKFVIDGERWITDPKADKTLEQDDGFGGKNSGVMFGKGAAPTPAKVSADDGKGQLFSLDTSGWDQKPNTVNLAGDFNGWNKGALPMLKTGETWSVHLPLDDGVHQYKFVIDGDRWINDPKADKALEVSDGNGGMNSGLVVGADPRKLPPVKDNAINVEAVKFDPNSADDIAVVDEHSFRARIRTQKDDVKQASVMVQDSAGRHAIPLTKIDSDLWGDTFAGVAQVSASPATYWIELKDGTATVDVGSGTAADVPALKAAGGKPVVAVSLEMKPKFVTPDWAKHAVWYQIFPERFRNGDPSNDPGDALNEHLIKWTSDWWKDQPGENPAGPDNFYKGAGNVWKRRYGGDIQGIQQELPYLKSLGINAIYLNPIFEAQSMHKYDTIDYRHVDQHFGVREKIPLDGETDDPSTWKWSKSDQVFLNFLDEAHKQGFKVCIDGVFNHVGTADPMFQDVMMNGKASKYADWFEVSDYTPGHIHYKAWDGADGALPVWKKDAKLGLAHGPREHVLSVMKRWLAPNGDPSRGVDGVRLDAANEVPHPFWIDFRKTVKETKPDAIIIGEIWDWSTPWLGGDQFDAVMNYQFAMPSQGFFVDEFKALKPSQFEQKLNKVVYTYPLQVAQVQMNLFDSHDTDRFASMFLNPDLGYDNSNRLEDSGAKYNIGKPNDEQRARMLQAVAFQMTFVGAPMIYYGDEAGMWGPDDPSDREPMTWRDLQPYDDPQITFDDHVFSAYQRQIAIRQKLPALQGVQYGSLLADDTKGTFAFARGEAEPVVVVLNRSPQKQLIRVPVTNTKPMIDWNNPSAATLQASQDQPPTISATSGASIITPHSGSISVELEPYGTAILAGK